MWKVVTLSTLFHTSRQEIDFVFPEDASEHLSDVEIAKVVFFYGVSMGSFNMKWTFQ